MGSQVIELPVRKPGHMVSRTGSTDGSFETSQKSTAEAVTKADGRPTSPSLPTVKVPVQDDSTARTPDCNAHSGDR